ncbi:MAG: hypothetical protein ACTSQ0_08250 [Candidatus Heimdallarchaeota archaeon]
MVEVEKSNQKCDSCGIELDTDVEMCTRCVKYKDDNRYFLSLILTCTDKDLIGGFHYVDYNMTFRKCWEEMMAMPYWKEQQKQGRDLISLERIIIEFESPRKFKLPAFD